MLALSNEEAVFKTFIQGQRPGAGSWIPKASISASVSSKFGHCLPKRRPQDPFGQITKKFQNKSILQFVAETLCKLIWRFLLAEAIFKTFIHSQKERFETN